jgi:hypothetical protein
MAYEVLFLSQQLQIWLRCVTPELYFKKTRDTETLHQKFFHIIARMRQK